MPQSTVRIGSALLPVSGLIGCGERSPSQLATSAAQPAAAPQRPALLPEELTRRAFERRAIEAINWGMPAVNEDLMLQAMIVSAKGRTNQIARDYLLFYEYFHGDNGAGLGASHQTGWTGAVASLMQLFGALDADTLLAAGKGGAFTRGTSRVR